VLRLWNSSGRHERKGRDVQFSLKRVLVDGTIMNLLLTKDYWFHFEVSFLGWTQWISILVAGLVLGGLSMIRLGGKQQSEEETAA
jgi:hypothetical protein